MPHIYLLKYNMNSAVFWFVHVLNSLIGFNGSLWSFPLSLKHKNLCIKFYYFRPSWAYREGWLVLCYSSDRSFLIAFHFTECRTKSLQWPAKPSRICCPQSSTSPASPDTFPFATLFQVSFSVANFHFMSPACPTRSYLEAFALTISLPVILFPKVYVTGCFTSFRLSLYVSFHGNFLDLITI